MEKKEPLYTVGGNVNWCSHNGKHYRDSSKKQHRTTIQFNNPTSGFIDQKKKKQKRKTKATKNI